MKKNRYGVAIIVLCQALCFTLAFHWARLNNVSKFVASQATWESTLSNEEVHQYQYLAECFEPALQEGRKKVVGFYFSRQPQHYTFHYVTQGSLGWLEAYSVDTDYLLSLCITAYLEGDIKTLPSNIWIDNSPDFVEGSKLATITLSQEAISEFVLKKGVRSS